MRSAVMTVFACSDLGSSTKLSQPARKWALHFFTVFLDTVLSMYSDHPVMNSSQFNTFSCEKLDNTLVFLNHWILQHKHHLIFTCTFASIGWCSLSEPLLSPPAHAPIPNGNFSPINRCLATFPHSSIGKYANSYVVTTFRTFPSEHT